MKAWLVSVLALSACSSEVCEVADPFEVADAIVIGEIVSVRQTQKRLFVFGVNEWQAEVVTLRSIHGEPPSRFVYNASDAVKA